ncbi:putative ABC transporter CDR4 [Glarea lozoyensis 74030]|uniref:Putative ABC transporter CDR4 n=1 Tax=Glarea lozoyensis (strain ATCC 74030 / MF5533) TaxID=1104152 RepID=H0ERC6_GLAL7|nr:putative ABC transporter CDR4 [Glarea lozoyensis 74030]
MAMATGPGWPASAQAVAQDVEASLEGKRSKYTSGDEEKNMMREGTPGESYTESSEDGGEKVHELARAITQASIKNANGEHINPFDGPENPALDPLSGKFSYKVWTKNLLGIQSRDPERYPARVAGISYRNLSAYGFGNATDYQKTFGNYPLELPGLFKRMIGRQEQTKIQILRNFDGLVKSGEMLVVLGRPGSGCSTLLKTISGETNGFHLDPESNINYQGIPMEMMHNDFRGECIYQAEVDVHFPQLTVGQTLEFAALARTPRNRIPGVTREAYATHMRDVIMAVFGLSHTINTQVGNDFIRGVSGGERKRVSIAEAALGGSPLQCWDNSTRGLDSATALEFVRTLRLSTEMAGCAAVVAIYQASQAIYDVFDKVAVLYEGRQIYFGNIHAAKEFFVNMGFECPLRQTTADFLTSLTSPAERVVRKGFEGLTPFTPDEFAAKWYESADRARLMQEIKAFEEEFPVGGGHLEEFKDARRAAQAKAQRVKSPRGALIFFAILMAAFQSFLEIITLYAQRPIVEKQAKYAFYHPISEAIDLPNKIGVTLIFDFIVYFMTNLRRTPEAFFVFLLFTFTCTLVMSMFFRSIASLSRTLAQAMAPAAIFILALIIYTGFAIPTRNMHPWFRWINYLDPVAYAFEALMVNEFSGRRLDCVQFVPMGDAYLNSSPSERVCATTGAAAGADFVDGDTWLRVNYQYEYSHLWRNFGILLALVVGGCAVYLTATEYISAKKSKGEVLLFRRGRIPDMGSNKADEETAQVEDDRINTETVLTRTKTTPDAPASIQKQTAIFHWDNVNYDIKIKKEPRRLLDAVDGWVKPGTLTALMGVSGAGKTTLLDVLASRTTMGVVTGEMLIDGRQRNTGFQRKTGYVQQQDLHLATTTVREALNFSAVLRQPKSTPHAEKIAYVDEVIKVLEMEAYADAVVGVPGEGLNVEQRKRLTIGVELAAKPALLLFLDEPTSGLDSQTAWSICALLPILFQEFDRLLFLAKGGKTVYFGPIGKDSKDLTAYFERNGSQKFGIDENPAEVMLEVIGAAPGSETTIDWPAVWNASPERAEVKAHLAELKATLSQKEIVEDPTALDPYAASFTVQMWTVLKRVFQQYWRTPTYLYSKTVLCVLTGLFIGFSFWDAPTSLQGMQNQLFAIFMLLTIFGNLVQQIMPLFVVQRSLYEVRERPSKTYSWQVFIVSNILVELPWNSLMGVLIFVTWYYPIGLFRNAEATDAVTERGGLMFLFILSFLLFTSTFTNMIIAGIESAEAGANLAQLLFSLCLIFNGVLASPDQFPRFWIFMYRVSPFTYLVSGVMSTGIANTAVVCSDIEYLTFDPPASTTCEAYLAPYISAAGGYLTDATKQATSACRFCSLADSNQFLAAVNIKYSERWRNYGIFWVYILFNVAAAVFLYWLARVPKVKKEEKEKKE